MNVSKVNFVRSWEGSSFMEEKQNLPWLLNTGSSVILNGRKTWTVYLVDRFLWQSDLAVVQTEPCTNSKKNSMFWPQYYQCFDSDDRELVFYSELNYDFVIVNTWQSSRKCFPLLPVLRCVLIGGVDNSSSVGKWEGLVCRFQDI